MPPGLAVQIQLGLGAAALGAAALAAVFAAAALATAALAAALAAGARLRFQGVDGGKII